MAADLESKTIVVTGAESGIGRAIALACANAGASVALGGLDRDKLAETARVAEQAGVRAFAQVTDIRSEDAVDALLEQAASRLGGIDAVVANAGVIGQRRPTEELRMADWKQTFDVNLFGTINTITAGARRLLQQRRGGSLIATGSSAALRPIPGLLPYAVSKGAVHTLIHGLALELAPHRIRVNLLVPGTTATDATRAMPGYLETAGKALPMGEVVEADELAALVVFALSDKAPHMTGTMLKIDSGRTL